MRLVREWEKVELFTTQVRALEHARREAVRHANEPAVALVRRLRELRGIGDHAAWLFVMRWREQWQPGEASPGGS
jgi:hypothetical protein